PLFEALREAAKVLPEVVPLIKDIGKNFIGEAKRPGSSRALPFSRGFFRFFQGGGHLEALLKLYCGRDC
ncbi:MAG: hypothetical protein ACUVSP_10860, partial [Desulfotomaculales bacterium]